MYLSYIIYNLTKIYIPINNIFKYVKDRDKRQNYFLHKYNIKYTQWWDGSQYHSLYASLTIRCVILFQKMLQNNMAINTIHHIAY